MKYYSTSNKNEFVSLKEAVLKGTGKNDGLYLPEKLPLFEQELTNVSYHEMAFEILNPFVNEDINKSTLENIVKDTFNFPVKISSFNNEHFLELFHGPTLAFKDFGARFLANIIEEFNKDNSTKLNVLVATSGDTGSAVANAFYGKESVNVIVLYPSNGVSEIQEKQIATFDKNIIALEVKGSFDDCQSLLKNALNDDSIKGEFKLTTANSINIARLLPQTIYYFEALRQLNLSGKTLITVPSGNLGNLTAGLLAKLMGQKIDGFVSAVNDNKFFKLFLDE
jgi:threonine synthase